MTLATIGFGDYVPRSSQKAGFGGYSDEISIALCSVYLLFGISLLVMTFNLMQESGMSAETWALSRMMITIWIETSCRQTLF